MENNRRHTLFVVSCTVNVPSLHNTFLNLSYCIAVIRFHIILSWQLVVFGRTKVLATFIPSIYVLSLILISIIQILFDKMNKQRNRYLLITIIVLKCHNSEQFIKSSLLITFTCKLKTRLSLMTITTLNILALSISVACSNRRKFNGINMVVSRNILYLVEKPIPKKIFLKMRWRLTFAKVYMWIIIFIK